MSATEDSYENSSVLEKLNEAIGKDNVTISKMERLLYSHDMAPLPKEAQVAFKVIPDIVVRPKSIEDVSAVVKIAAEEGVPITPRGASTWGLAGSTPAFGGILIDMLGGMSKIVSIDETNMTITAQAGCSWKQVYDAAWEAGFLLGSYPSSFPSATIGGWTSTSGIGLANYKYGSARDNIRSMKVVIPDGSIVTTGFERVSDNMSGYNLNHLFVGAEGTLGVICEITFKLTPRPEVLRPIAYSFESLDKAEGALCEISHSRLTVLHIGFSDANHFKMQNRAGIVDHEFGSIILVALEGYKTVVDYEETVLDEIMERNGGKKEAPEVGEHEWEERCYEFRCRKVGLGSVPGEVIVPVHSFAKMTKDVYELMDSMKMEGAIIGIMADRNTVMFMPYYVYNSESMSKSVSSLSFDYQCGELAKANGGRMLGGFGLFFGSTLSQVRGEGYKIEVGIKNAIDPEEIMNPGKLLGMETRFGLSVTPEMLGFGMSALSAFKKIMGKDKNFEKKAEAYDLEELEKAKFEQYKVDPLKQEKD